ncbi:ISAs1 family transposase [Glycomyces sp. L485]|nr:ISAs1 family transposase [Glycomyces sp. L485]
MSDPRGAQGRCYPLAVFVAVALAGLLCGRNTPAQWARWAADAPDAVVRALGGIGLEVGGAAWWSLPSYNRLIEVLSGLDPDELARFAARIVPAEEEASASKTRQVRIDGKRPVTAGRVTGDGSKLILVGALGPDGRMADQVCVDDGDEIGALRAVCGRLDAEGALVSADALHCNEDTAAAIVEAGADYCLALKGNHPSLYAAAKALPWSEIDNAVETRETGHGRSETRTVKILAVGGAVRLSFPGVAQIARVRRWTRDEATGEVVHHVIFYPTSRDATALRPVEFAEAVRNHWGVESWHWVKDVVFDEDRSTATAGNLTANLASLRAAAIAILTRLGGKGITACRDHIGSHPYTKPLEILGIAHIKQELQMCLSRECRGRAWRRRPDGEEGAGRGARRRGRQAEGRSGCDLLMPGRGRRACLLAQPTPSSRSRPMSKRIARAQLLRQVVRVALVREVELVLQVGEVIVHWGWPRASLKPAGAASCVVDVAVLAAVALEHLEQVASSEKTPQ